MAEVELDAGRLDRWKRYKLPHPESGRDVAWTRCTTLAKTLDDMAGIHRAKMRDLVLGIAARPDLYALACATDADDKRGMSDLIDKALAAAKVDAKSNIGTALHKFTERADTGQADRAPDPFRRDIDAYREATKTAGVTMDVRQIERITVVPELAVAGTFDRMVQIGGRWYIADLKTGNVDRAWMSIAIQLGVYAHGVALWDDEREEYDPMPEVDKSLGVVIHLPAGRGECTLYWVDIATGWEMAQVAYKVRGWRQRKDFAVPFTKTQEESEAA